MMHSASSCKIQLMKILIYRYTLSPFWSPLHCSFHTGTSKTYLCHLQVKDDNRQTTLGSLSISLTRLLSADNLTLDQWFPLENSGPNSRIYMKLIMKVKGTAFGNALFRLLVCYRFILYPPPFLFHFLYCISCFEILVDLRGQLQML